MRNSCSARRRQKKILINRSVYRIIESGAFDCTALDVQLTKIRNCKRRVLFGAPLFAHLLRSLVVSVKYYVSAGLDNACFGGSNLLDRIAEIQHMIVIDRCNYGGLRCVDDICRI